jgi:hypothetical protein
MMSGYLLSVSDSFYSDGAASSPLEGCVGALRASTEGCGDACVSTILRNQIPIRIRAIPLFNKRIRTLRSGDTSRHW